MTLMHPSDPNDRVLRWTCVHAGTGEPLGELIAATPTIVAQAVDKARHAQHAWSQTTFAQRAAVLDDVLDWLVDHSAEITEVLEKVVGTTAADVMIAELFPLCEKVRYLLAEGEQVLRANDRSPGIMVHKSVSVGYLPLGVVATFTPASLPLYHLYAPLLGALFAGNAVITKPSPHVGWASEVLIEPLHRILRKHGHAAELAQVLQGGADTGQAILNANPDLAICIGSPPAGRSLLAQAAARGVPTIAAMGSNDAIIVCDDASLTQAASAILHGCALAGGQMPTRVGRVYAMREIHDELVDILLTRLAHDPQSQPEHGCPLVRPGEVDVIEALLADAVAQGAKIRCGGQRSSGRGERFPKTLVTNVASDCALVQSDLRAPILPIVCVRDDVQAVRLVNESTLGLATTVLTRSVDRGRKIAASLRVAMVSINDWGACHALATLPYGGSGSAGMGRIYGPEGLRAMCRIKTTLEDRLALGRPETFDLQSERTYDLLRDTLRSLYARSARRKTRAVLDTARALASIVRDKLRVP